MPAVEVTSRGFRLYPGSVRASNATSTFATPAANKRKEIEELKKVVQNADSFTEFDRMNSHEEKGSEKFLTTEFQSKTARKPIKKAELMKPSISEDMTQSMDRHFSYSTFNKTFGSGYKPSKSFEQFLKRGSQPVFMDRTESIDFLNYFNQGQAEVPALITEDNNDEKSETSTAREESLLKEVDYLEKSENLKWHDSVPLIETPGDYRKNELVPKLTKNNDTLSRFLEEVQGALAIDNIPSPSAKENENKLVIPSFNTQLYHRKKDADDSFAAIDILNTSEMNMTPKMKKEITDDDRELEDEILKECFDNNECGY